MGRKAKCTAEEKVTAVEDYLNGIRRTFLIILGIMLINIAAFSALLSRFDFRLGEIPLYYSEAVLSYALINTITSKYQTNRMDI